MKITQTGLGSAICKGMGAIKEVDTLFIGEQKPGTWVLVFLNSAREVLSEEDAKKITQAMSALMDLPQATDKETHQLWLKRYFSDLTEQPIRKPESRLELSSVLDAVNKTSDL